MRVRPAKSRFVSAAIASLTGATLLLPLMSPRAGGAEASPDSSGSADAVSALSGAPTSAIALPGGLKFTGSYDGKSSCGNGESGTAGGTFTLTTGTGGPIRGTGVDNDYGLFNISGYINANGKIDLSIDIPGVGTVGSFKGAVTDSTSRVNASGTWAASGFGCTSGGGWSASALKQAPKLEIVMVNPPSSNTYKITDAPAMPQIQAVVKVTGVDASTVAALPFHWKAEIKYHRDFIPDKNGNSHAPVDLNYTSPVTTITGSGDTHPYISNFGTKIYGGDLKISVSTTINGQAYSADTAALNLKIRGTNPTKSVVQRALPHDTLRRIATQEVYQYGGQVQFDRQGLPIWNPVDGGVGMMQYTVKETPSADVVWSWRGNVAAGIKRFNGNFGIVAAYARVLQQPVNGFVTFAQLVENTNAARNAQINSERARHDLPSLPRSATDLRIVVPPFPAPGSYNGIVTARNQFELDMIRGYNGFNGTDLFGHSLHEFKIGISQASNKQVLVLANISEAARTANAVWQRVLPSERPSSGEPNYVTLVLLRSPNGF